MVSVGLSLHASAADERVRWDRKKWGPVISHKQFPKDCGLCHTAKNWGVLREDFRFDHKKETGFALEGGHASAVCLRCHNDRGPVKGYTARGCAGCHLDPHRGSNGLDCLRCHNQNSWRVDNVIDVHARTPFPLSGRHRTLQCEECHSRAAAGDYRGTPTECYACHAVDFQRGPSHVANGYSTVCWKCHSTVSFSGARFDHSGLGPNPNCYACHADDYNRAPNHSTVGFPTTCGSCHTAGGSWSGASLNHPFPQNHKGSTCMQCHQGGTPSNFSCLGCHAKPVTDGHHGGVPGYSYSSPACYSCHRNGEAD